MCKQLLVDFHDRPVFFVDVIYDDGVARIARIKDALAGDLKRTLCFRERHMTGDADSDQLHLVRVIALPAE